MTFTDIALLCLSGLLTSACGCVGWLWRRILADERRMGEMRAEYQGATAALDKDLRDTIAQAIDAQNARIAAGQQTMIERIAAFEGTLKAQDVRSSVTAVHRRVDEAVEKMGEIKGLQGGIRDLLATMHQHMLDRA